MSLSNVKRSLRDGEFVIIHDAQRREDEFDIVMAAEFATPRRISTMRQDGGGLLCLALEYGFSQALGIRYMHNILADANVPQKMIMGVAPYGDHPTFSISVNHIRTWTGVTDVDRARTITELTALYGTDDIAERFVESFRTPGHVQLLVASQGLLKDRGGHTEMSVYLAKAAGLKPAAVICEMIDSKSGLALSGLDVTRYATKKNIPILEYDQIVKYIDDAG